MTRYIGLLVAVAGVIAGLMFAYNKWNAKVAETSRELNVARIRAEYAERIPWLRVNPVEKAYKDEAQTFFRWYFKEVNEHLNKYGGNRNFDDYLAELSERSTKPGAKLDSMDDKKAAYEYTRKWFDLIKSGQYDPMRTSTDNGIRLDIVGTKPGLSAKKTRFEFVVWGLAREEKIVDDRGTRKMIVSASYKQNWKFFDEKGKLFGEMPVDGVDMKVDWPDRYVKWFPTQLVPGHFELDKIPNEVKNAEVTFTITTRSLTGGEIISNHLWKLDLPAEWKLAPGEKWEGAQDSIRPEEEINANVVDPKKKK